MGFGILSVLREFWFLRKEERSVWQPFCSRYTPVEKFAGGQQGIPRLGNPPVVGSTLSTWVRFGYFFRAGCYLYCPSEVPCNHRVSPSRFALAMGLEDLLEYHNPDLFGALQRVQNRGGRESKTLSRRKSIFLHIIAFLNGFIAGRAGSRRQKDRRLARLRVRREELDAGHLPERGDTVVDWSSEEEPLTPPHLDDRSRSPAARATVPLQKARPRPSSASGAGSESLGSDSRHPPEQLRVEGDTGSGSREVRAPKAEAKGSPPGLPPTPPSPRPKAPSGIRTPVPPAGSRVGSAASSGDIGRSAYRDVISERTTRILEDTLSSSAAASSSDPVSIPKAGVPKATAPVPPAVIPKAVVPKATVPVPHFPRSLDWPPRHAVDLTTLAEGICTDISVNSGAATVFSYDMRNVCDASPINDVRSIVDAIGRHPRAAILICSYSPIASPFRQSTYRFAQGLVRYTGVQVSLVQTSGKARGPASKASFLTALTEQLNNISNVDFGLIHWDDSQDIISSLQNIPQVEGVLWDGRRRQRWTLLEHTQYRLDQL